MKWVSQISEYWSISDMTSILSGDLAADVLGSPQPVPDVTSQHSLDISRPLTSERQETALLVSSGPGHPSLLTLVAHTTLIREVDFVLADILLSEVAVIPGYTEVRVVRKILGMRRLISRR